MFYTGVGETLAQVAQEVGDAPSLETSKARLDGALSNLIKLKMSLLTAWGLDWMTFKGPFQSKLFYDSMTSFSQRKYSWVLMN